MRLIYAFDPPSRKRIGLVGLLLVVLVAGSALWLVGRSPSGVSGAGHDPLTYPFDAGQTWQVVEGYNSSGTHNSSGLDQYALDLVRAGHDSGNETIRAVFGGTIVRSTNFYDQGCEVIIGAPDGVKFLYVHLNYSPSYPSCNTVVAGQPVSQGQPIGTVYTGQPGGINHVHVQWCNSGFAGCSDGGAKRPLVDGVFQFPSPGPRDRCSNGEWCGYTLTSPPTPPTPNPDVDGDGMPNTYEQAYGCLNPNVADGSGDPDHDEFTSLTEYLLGSNPCRDSIRLTYSASAGWMDAGIGVTAGEWFSSSATGVAYTNPSNPPVGPDGWAAYPDYGWNHCTSAELVGYIGTTPPDPNDSGQPNVFCLGAQKAVVAPATGRLYLAMNDPGAFWDNSGSWTIDITRGGTFNYQGNEGWRDTGFNLTAGEWFSDSATGVAYTSPGSAPVGPDGLAAYPDYGWNNCTLAELVGYIGTTPPDPNTVPLPNTFCLGAGSAVVAPATGRLYLAMNDPGAFSDNSGSWSIDITPGGTFNYQANEGWRDTGLSLTAGEWFSDSATGVAYTNPSNPPVGPDGWAAYPDYGWNHCTSAELVGYIGTTPPDPNDSGQPNVFCLGAQKAVVAPATGRLYLAMNDPGAWGDNSGSWFVEIMRGGTLKYHASDGWFDTKLSVSTGATVSETALGNARYSAGSPMTGPDGSAPGPFGWAGCRETQLVAVIAAEPPDPNTVPLSGVVCVGAIGSFVASATGGLYVAMNDPGAFGDNSGRWSIRVSYTPAPAAVGGIADMPDVPGAHLESSASDKSRIPVPAEVAAALAAGVVALGVGGWYARRRWLT